MGARVLVDYLAFLVVVDPLWAPDFLPEDLARLVPDLLLADLALGDLPAGLDDGLLAALDASPDFFAGLGCSSLSLSLSLQLSLSLSLSLSYVSSSLSSSCGFMKGEL